MKRWTWRGVLLTMFGYAILAPLGAAGIDTLINRLRLNVDARTIADNGGGTAATLTLTPKSSYVALTCSDTDGCVVTLSETSALDGLVLIIENKSANAVTMSTSAGVQQLPATCTLTQYATVAFDYMTDRWVMRSCSTAITSGISSTTLCTLANWCQTTATLTDAQIKALPTTAIQVIAAPGSGFRIKILGASYVLRQTTTSYTGLNATYSALALCDIDATGRWIAQGIANDSSVGLSDLSTFLAGAAHNALIDLSTLQDPIQGASSGDRLWLAVNSGAFTSGIVDNKPVMISIDNSMSGNLGGGNAANTLKVIVYWAKEAV